MTRAPQAGSGTAQSQPSPVCTKPRRLDFPQDDRWLGLEEAGKRRSRMMFSSTTDFRLLKAAIGSRKGGGTNCWALHQSRSPPRPAAWSSAGCRLLGAFWGLREGLCGIPGYPAWGERAIPALRACQCPSLSASMEKWIPGTKEDSEWEE